MFHLSLPVAHYRDCLDFYRTCFGAEIVELSATAANVFAFGAQITLHDDPASLLTPRVREQFHFGAVVEVQAWADLRDRLIQTGDALLTRADPDPAFGRRGKLIVADPSGNRVEVNSAPA